MQITDTLGTLVAEALDSAQTSGKLPAAGDVEIKIERPKLTEHGDFSTSLPLALARSMRMAPLKIAEAISNAIPDHAMVGSVEHAAPGFVNFTLSTAWLQSQVDEIRNVGAGFGSVEVGVGKRVQVEFVSVNPTGPLHVGHARGAVIGSSLANVLDAAGYDVQREYYVNDAGNQMRLFNDTLYSRYMQAAGHDVALPEQAYSGEYVGELAADLLKDLGDGAVSKDKTDAIAELAPEALSRTVADIDSVLGRLGVSYDQWFYEGELLKSGRFENVLKLLEDTDLIVERDGAKWFAATKLGLEEDIVVIRSGDGGPTYFGTDLAYHHEKFFERNFDRVINVWGADHHAHVARMQVLMKALGIDPDRLTIIINQIVNFKNEGESVKFSKRNNVMVTIEELLEEVDADACRFIFLSRSPESHMEFDLALAKTQSSENPVYYVQYAHARMCSILRTAEERGVTFDAADLSLLTHDRELELVRKLIELPAVVERAAERLEPHHLPYFAMELARTLQRFYEACRVVSSEPDDLEMSRARLQLVDAARVVLARTLSLMGMRAPTRM
ncbi:MAG: arginine--tRNA ligase [Dehalococcoidia bacterium]|jgi:arginyl-tRNA synthetase|nr:arginine--tRNA ligase [Dehalococcoidia bacterium]